MILYNQRQKEIINNASMAIQIHDYQKAATELQNAFTTVLEGCLVYYGKKPGNSLKNTVQRLLDQINNQDFSNSLINAYNRISEALQNPNRETVDLAKTSYHGMLYYFYYILSDVDSGKRYKSERRKNTFKSGIMDGKICLLYISIILVVTMAISSIVILVLGPDNGNAIKSLSLSFCITIFIITLAVDFAVMFYPETVSLVIFTIIVAFLAYMTFHSLPMALLFAAGLQLVSICVAGIVKIMEILYYVMSIIIKGFMAYHVIFEIIKIDVDNTGLLIIFSALPAIIIIGTAIFMYQKKYNRDGSLFTHVQVFYKYRTIIVGLLLSSIPLYPYRQEIIDGLLLSSKNAADNIYSFAMSHLILTFIAIKIVIMIFRRR